MTNKSEASPTRYPPVTHPPTHPLTPHPSPGLLRLLGTAPERRRRVGEPRVALEALARGGARALRGVGDRHAAVLHLDHRATCRTRSTSLGRVESGVRLFHPQRVQRKRLRLNNPEEGNRMKC